MRQYYTLIISLSFNIESLLLIWFVSPFSKVNNGLSTSLQLYVIAAIQCLRFRAKAAFLSAIVLCLVCTLHTFLALYTVSRPEPKVSNCLKVQTSRLILQQAFFSSSQCIYAARRKCFKKPYILVVNAFVVLKVEQSFRSVNPFITNRKVGKLKR